jgi:hypothetical protein
VRFTRISHRVLAVAQLGLIAVANSVAGLPASAAPPGEAAPQTRGVSAAPAPQAVAGGGETSELPPLEIGLSANQQSFDAQLGRVVASGNAAATLAGGQIRAERIEYDVNSRTVYAIGAVRFQRGQQYLQASKLRYSLLEGVGEIEDVYGVLDLDTSAQDLDIEQPPSQPLGLTPPMACTPKIPELANWHPYPWAATVWAGQMVNANFGDTFIFRGSWRPEYLTGINLQRRLLDGGPFTIETDLNLMGHIASLWPMARCRPRASAREPWAWACGCGCGPG